MNFSTALKAIQAGEFVTNDDWNGKDMFIFLVPGSVFDVNRPPLLGIFKEGTRITYRPHIDMRYADGSIGPWTPSQLDMDSKAWSIVDKLFIQGEQ